MCVCLLASLTTCLLADPFDSRCPSTKCLFQSPPFLCSRQNAMSPGNLQRLCSDLVVARCPNVKCCPRSYCNFRSTLAYHGHHIIPTINDSNDPRIHSTDPRKNHVCQTFCRVVTHPPHRIQLFSLRVLPRAQVLRSVQNAMTRYDRNLNGVPDGLNTPLALLGLLDPPTGCLIQDKSSQSNPKNRHLRPKIYL